MPTVRPRSPSLVHALIERLAALLAGLGPCPGCGGAPIGSSGVCLACRAAYGAARRDGDILALGPYAGTLGALIRNAKFEGGTRLLDDLGAVLGHALVTMAAQDQRIRGALLVPVPSHRRRRARRGGDPSERLARAIAHAADGYPVVPALWRPRHAAPQSTRHVAERHANVRGAFAVRPGLSPALRGRRVVLVDDVLTTGATARAAAEPLRAVGAAIVLVVVAAGPSAATSEGQSATSTPVAMPSKAPAST